MPSPRHKNHREHLKSYVTQAIAMFLWGSDKFLKQRPLLRRSSKLEAIIILTNKFWKEIIPQISLHYLTLKCQLHYLA